MSRAIQRVLLIAAISSVVTLAGRVDPARAQTAVTACGQAVAGAGYLTGDLDCGSDVEAAVQVRNGGSLDLRGFTLRGGRIGVLCADSPAIVGPSGGGDYTSCRIFGGGTIEGQTVVGIAAGRLAIGDVTVQAETSVAVIVHDTLTFTNLTLQLGTPTGGVGIQTDHRIVGIGLTMVGGTGISGSGRASVKIRGVIATGYRTFTWGPLRSVKLTNASLTGGVYAVPDARYVTLTKSSVTAHSATAIQASRVALSSSTVAFNALDLQTEHRPKLSNATCGTSNGWGVCVND